VNAFVFPTRVSLQKLREWLYPESASPLPGDLVSETPAPESSCPLGPGCRRHKAVAMPSLFHVDLEALCHSEIQCETTSRSEALPLGKQPPLGSTGRM